MKRAVIALSVLTATALLSPSAEALPAFPIVLTGGECYGTPAQCSDPLNQYAVTWTVLADGTFSDGFGASGIWSYDPATGSGALTYTYSPAYVFENVYAGSYSAGCVQGTITEPGAGVVGYWRGCI